MKRELFFYRYEDNGRDKNPVYPKSFREGEFYKSKRMCGVEIEAVNPKYLYLQAQKEVQSIKQFKVNDYCDSEVKKLIHTDGEEFFEKSKLFYDRLHYINENVSHSTDAGGLEIQTPPASGLEFERNMYGFCDVLQDYGFTGSNSCGGHIHLDLNKDYDNDKLVRLADFYIGFEKWIYSVLPKWRRVSNWCTKIGTTVDTTKELKKIKEENQITQYNLFTNLWNSKIGSGKSHGFNLGFSLNNGITNKHIELRYHEGTVNPLDFIHWATIHTSVLDFVSKNSESANGRKYLNEITDYMQRNKIGFYKIQTILRKDILIEKETLKHFVNRHKRFLKQ